MSERPVSEAHRRMLAGELYDAADPALVADRIRARRLVRLYNTSTEEEGPRRQELLAELFARIGSGATIEPDFRCDYGWNVQIGTGFFANFGCVMLDCAPISIGDRVLFGPGVHLYAATHPIAPEVRAKGLELALPIVIGSDVWIGGGAIVGPGVRIGDGAVVGAGSVVTHDVPARVVAAGVPCRVLRPVGSEQDPTRHG